MQSGRLCWDRKYMEFLTMCSSMLSIILMVAVGMLLTHLKWLNESAKDFLIHVTVKLALPTLMFKNVVCDFTKSEILAMKGNIAIPAISIGITMLLGILLAKLLKIEPGKKGLFISMFFNSNTIFVGLPVNIALNGEGCVPYVMLYYMASTCFFWTLGVYFISADSRNGNKAKLFSLATVKNVLSLPLVSFILAVVWLMTEWKLPDFLLNVITYFGNLTTPLSMLFIGSCMYSISLKNFRLKKEVWGVLAGRFLAAPLIILCVMHFLPVQQEIGKVFVVQAAMPVMTNTAILARAYQCDEEYAAVMTVITTVMCVVVVPVYYCIYGRIC